MKTDEMKRAAAEAALKYIPDDSVIGIGTGSTTNFFIELLADIKNRIEGAVASSEASATLLKQYNIPVLDLNSAGDIPVYVDGADEINPHLQLIKGGGGALTREKIIAAASKQFICIADHSKETDILGSFPLPVEVIPMARSYVARQIVKLGGNPALRENYVTDNHNIILDIHNLQIMEPISLEKTINNIAGVVTVGLFALRPADIALLAGKNGVEIRNAP